MFFSLYRKGPLFTNTVLNDYIKNSEYTYMKNINKTIENQNIDKKIKKNILAGETDGIEENSLIVIPSILYVFASNISIILILNFFYHIFDFKYMNYIYIYLKY